MKHIRTLIAAGALLATAALSAQTLNYANGNGMTPDRKISYVERVIEQYYIDDVDGDKIAEEAIKAMLLTLDPHSSYSNADETREMTQPLEGNFSGIGIQFNMLNDTLFVIQTTAGGPSEKVGILPGDRIIKADDEMISGVKKANSDVIKILRGPKGTPVNVSVLRKGIGKPLSFKIVRDDIPISSIDTYYMADPTTGYIRITRFANTTDKEFVSALRDLKKKGMKNLIIDLSDNGGGYLNSAVNIASHLLPPEALITYTESPKMMQTVYRATPTKDFVDGRVVIMANQYSASASEILSGAVQDHDRGLVVGRRTFGKGLVQRPFPLPDGSMIRLTVSRYHTPSGRVIQKPYELGNSEDYKMDMKHRYENGEFSSTDNIVFPDSLKFKTLNRKRDVYGGGGIMPDLFVPIDTVANTEYYRDLVAKGVINRFSLTYTDDNRDRLLKAYPNADAFIATFKVTPAMMNDVVALGKSEGVELNEEQYALSRNTMEVIIKGLIGRNLFESSTYYRIVGPQLDPIYQAALELINSPTKYDALLSGD